MSSRGGKQRSRGDERRIQEVKAPKGDFFEVDGSVLEGGGQILRMSACYSALLGKSIHVNRIRAGRAQGGLKAQHLAGLQLIEQLCQGKLTGGFVGSTEIWLQPGDLKGGKLTSDPGTAGAITLLVQVALPCILFTQNTDNLLDLRGGTNVAFSPPIEYAQQLLLEILARQCGIHAKLDLAKRGFYPKGGGKVTLSTDAKRLDNNIIAPIALDLTHDRRVTSINIHAWSYPEPFDDSYKPQFMNSLKEQFQKHGILLDDGQITITYNERSQEARNACSGVWMTASVGKLVFGADALLDRNKSIFQSIVDAFEFLARNIAEGGAVDEHMQDQLIIFAVLASGTSKIRCGQLTMHTQTAIHISQLLTKANIVVNDNGDGTNTIVIEGIGFTR